MKSKNGLMALAALALFAGMVAPAAAQETEVESEGELTIDLEGNASQSSEVTVIVTDNGSAVANATVEVNGEEAGTTDSNGELVITVPDNINELEIEVEKGELEGSLEVEIETEDEEEETEEEPENETEEENETEGPPEDVPGGSAQFDARLMTAINTVDALTEIAPNDDVEQRLENALDILRGVQDDTDTASLGPDNRTEEDEGTEEEEPESETDEERDTGPGQRGPPEDAGPGNQGRGPPDFLGQLLGLFG